MYNQDLKEQLWEILEEVWLNHLTIYEAQDKILDLFSSPPDTTEECTCDTAIKAQLCKENGGAIHKLERLNRESLLPLSPPSPPPRYKYAATQTDAEGKTVITDKEPEGKLVRLTFAPQPIQPLGLDWSHNRISGEDATSIEMTLAEKINEIIRRDEE